MKINTKATVWCTNGHRSIEGNKRKLKERKIMYNKKEKFVEAYIHYNHCTSSKAKQRYEYLISQNSSYISELIFGYTMELRKRRIRESRLTYRPFIPMANAKSSR